MLSHQLGFKSSWRMLTRDKGWIKPVIAIALVSWIPIIGQIVVLGYGLEWARLTAWGVDAAPKQRKIDFAKMFSTGGIAFLISLIITSVMGVLVFLVARGAYTQIVTATGLGSAILQGFSTSSIAAFAEGGIGIATFAVLVLVGVIVETLILAAQMRATLYDGFLPGWRFDRLIQMVMRDAGGFAHTCLIVAASSLVAGLLEAAVALAGDYLLYRGLMLGMYAGMYGFDALQIVSFVRTGILPLLLAVLVAILILVLIQMVKVVFELVSINAMGQWFQRFDVGRWGVSSAPLPEDVPRRAAAASRADDAAAADTAGGPDEPAAADEGESKEPILLGPISTVDEDEHEGDLCDGEGPSSPTDSAV